MFKQCAKPRMSDSSSNKMNERLAVILAKLESGQFDDYLPVYSRSKKATEFVMDSLISHVVYNEQIRFPASSDTAARSKTKVVHDDVELAETLSKRLLTRLYCSAKLETVRYHKFGLVIFGFPLFKGNTVPKILSSKGFHILVRALLICLYLFM